jgi:hypothetical protein
MDQLHIEHGELVDVCGRAAEHNGITFVPAVVRLNGSCFSLEHYFRDHPAPERTNVPDPFDAAFIRARIPRLFGYTPLYDEGQEKSLICEGFIAVLADRQTAVPFMCSDCYGATGLLFSEDGPEPELRESIASSFWDLMLRDPDDVSDFHEAVLHLGAPVTLHFGCKHGEVYGYEQED